MHIQLHLNEPHDNCITWTFHGGIGVVDYMPYMNDSIQQAMIEPDEDWYMLLQMGWTMPFPARSFAMVARPIIGAPPNLKRVVMLTKNPLTRALVALTLGREPLLAERLHIVTSEAEGLALIR
jgi:hypothetical protein